MSTRATIECGEDWHLYTETFDDTVHLELEIYVNRRKVTANIPIDPATLNSIQEQLNEGRRLAEVETEDE